MTILIQIQSAAVEDGIPLQEASQGRRVVSCPVEVELGAELKEHAKSLPGSNYVKERREV